MNVPSEVYQQPGDRRVRVLHMITSLELGGAQAMLRKLLGGIDRSTFDNSVCSLVAGGPVAASIREMDIPVRSLGLSPGGLSVRAPVGLIKLLREERPDLVQCWMYHANLAGLLGTKLAWCGGRILWNVRHSLEDLSLEKSMTAVTIRLGALLSRWSDTIIYNSETSRRQHEALGFEAREAKVIPNGFDCRRFRPQSGARRELRKSLDLPARTLLIGMVARFHPMKDHRTLLQAAGLYRAAGGKGHFVLIGEGIHSGEPRLRDWARAAGAGESVHILPPRSEGMSRVTAGLDVATLSSAWGESFPNVIGEAMASGVPCVATDVGDVAEILGSTGVVVPPRDPEALAEAWFSMTRDEAYRERMGRQARRRIKEHYSLTDVIEQYERLYKERVGCSSSGRAFLPA